MSMRMICTSSRFHLCALGYAIQHAVLQQIFGALETFGQFLTNGLRNHARTSKTDQAFGSAICTSPSIA